MKCFTAHYLYLGHGQILPGQVICLDEAGRICSIQSFKDETASTVFMNGLICAAFGLCESERVMTPEEAVAFLSSIRNLYPSLQLKDILTNFTSNPELKIGETPVLWCIDSLNLKNLTLLEETVVYSVFP